MDVTEHTEGTEVVMGLVLLEMGATDRAVDSPRFELGHLPGNSAEETPSISGLLVGASRYTVPSMIWKYRKLLDKDKLSG